LRDPHESAWIPESGGIKLTLVKEWELKKKEEKKRKKEKGGDGSSSIREPFVLSFHRSHQVQVDIGSP